ncbi:MAG: thiol:disulfide interchange protein DsbA/DsbL [Burkholderiales bacterium]|jgi:thiol:disulfide interchange protein DsbA|nr:thiol:disulfide interchange protein DsbA/DsbL [Burkholderiales bacterium]
MKIVHPVFLCRSWLTALLSVFACAVLSLSSSAFAAATEGKEFRQIAPQTTEVPDGKIEVIEFFSYGCGHCANLNSQVDAWKKKLPDDVVFYKIPVSWGQAQWSAMARAFHALDAIGEESRLSGDVFKALQNERINLGDKKTFLDWAEKKGVDRKKLEEMYDSFAVNSKVMQSDKKVESYKVQSVPRFYVNGRYEINTDGIGSASQVLGVVDEVIAIARKGAKKK